MDAAVQISRELTVPPDVPVSVPALDLLTLTRGLAKGDEAAYRLFHDTYFDRLLRYLLVVTAGNEHLAREALQRTYTRLVKHVRVFDDEAVFWSWLTVLARSSLADETRQRRRYLAFLDRFTRFGEADPAPSGGESDIDNLNTRLDRAMETLPEDERRLVAWKYFERCSVRDIASRLAVTEKSVESRLSRIRQKLKDTVFTQLRHETWSQ